MITSYWEPEHRPEENFLEFYENLFKASDPQIIQKTLKEAKNAFKKSCGVFRLAALSTPSGSGTASKSKKIGIFKQYLFKTIAFKQYLIIKIGLIIFFMRINSK